MLLYACCGVWVFGFWPRLSFAGLADGLSVFFNEQNMECTDLSSVFDNPACCCNVWGCWPRPCRSFAGLVDRVSLCFNEEDVECSDLSPYV